MRLHAGMTLCGPTGGRRYLNAAKRRRFVKAANRLDPAAACFVLRRADVAAASLKSWRSRAAIDIDSGVAITEALKRRKRGIVRQVALLPDALRDRKMVVRFLFGLIAADLNLRRHRLLLRCNCLVTAANSGQYRNHRFLVRWPRAASKQARSTLEFQETVRRRIAAAKQQTACSTRLRDKAMKPVEAI